MSQVRGGKGEKEIIDFTGSNVGPLSGVLVGALATANQTVTYMNLKNNMLGAVGAAAVVAGLGTAPLKTLDLTRNGIGAQLGAEDANGAKIEALSLAICQQLRALADLRLDENDIDCPAKALEPICKLRNLRTLSLEKNRLVEIPSLIATMLSLRRISLHSNPHAIGNLKSLQKFDISENKIVELPISICELSDELQLSVGRNPLEKPSVEQARQGVTSRTRPLLLIATDDH